MSTTVAESLFAEIVTIFNADATAVLACRKMYEGFHGARAKTVLPFVEVHGLDAIPEDTFSGNGEVFDVQFSCFHKDFRPGGAHGMLKNISRIYEEVAFTDTAGSAWSGIEFSRTGATLPQLIDGVYQGILRYRVEVRKT